MLLPANLEVALHDRQPSREQRLADGHAVLELVPRVEEALLRPRGSRGGTCAHRAAETRGGGLLVKEGPSSSKKEECLGSV